MGSVVEIAEAPVRESRSTGLRAGLADPALLRHLIFVPVMLLLLAGLVMVLSSSMVFSLIKFGRATYFFDRQLVFAGIGLIVMLLASRLPVALYRRFTIPLLVASLIGLVLCLTPLALSVKGASRWISLGAGFNIQPSEIAKVAIVFWTADSMSRKADKVKSFKAGFLPHVIVAIIFAGLCMKQPDFGAAMMIVLLAFVMLFVGGTRLGYIVGSLLFMAPVAVIAVMSSPYRMQRVLAYLNPEEDSQGINYQIKESLISIGSGGAWGLGLGGGKQKLFFLPDAHTDFIASILGEEFGLIGLLVLLALFSIVVATGVTIALRSRDKHAAYLASGLTFYLAFQVVVNLCVVMGLLPTKGLALPFMSYGGSSLVTNLFAAGVLMSLAADIGGGRSEAPAAVDARRSGNVRLRESSGPPGDPADDRSDGPGVSPDASWIEEEGEG